MFKGPIIRPHRVQMRSTWSVFILAVSALWPLLVVGQNINCPLSFSNICPSPENASSFGRAIAVEENRLIVAAERAGAGIVYVYKLDGDRWEFERTLIPHVSSVGDEFGYSVAISGEGGQRIAIGAPGDSSGGGGVQCYDSSNTPCVPQSPNARPQSGAVYIYKGKNGNLEAFIKASNAESFDRFENSNPLLPLPNAWPCRFGTNVAIGSALIVGSPFEDSGSSGLNGLQTDNSVLNSGAAYSFIYSSSLGWIQRTYFKSPNPDPEDRFGTSVAITGTVFIVGAPYEDSIDPHVDGSTSDNSGDNTGSAYVYRRRGDGGDASFSTVLKSTDSLDPSFNNQVFGYSVAGTSVVENWIVIGAPASELSPLPGFIYVFDREDTDKWRFRSKIIGTDQDRYGFSVSAYNRIAVVGAPGSGVVEILKRSDGEYKLKGRQPVRPSNDSMWGFATGLSENNAAASSPAENALGAFDVSDLSGRTSDDDLPISEGQIVAVLIGFTMIVIGCIFCVVTIVLVAAFPIRKSFVTRWRYRKEHDLGRPGVMDRIKRVPEKVRWALDDFRGHHTFESDAPVIREETFDEMGSPRSSETEESSSDDTVSASSSG